MFTSERIQKIKATITEKKHISVTELSEILHVSDMTVRRDLHKLEEMNFLSRTHGGAIVNEYDHPIKDEPIDREPYDSQRIQISKLAAQMIEDNDQIVLGPGLTNQYIARELVNKRNLTVLTNDLKIVTELSRNNSIKIVIPGGDVELSSMTVVGKLAENQIKEFFVSKAFIEVDGVSMQHGYTVNESKNACMIRGMLEIAKERIIICPYICFDNIAFFKVGQLGLGSKVITNKMPIDLYQKFFSENNIELVQ